MQLIEKVPEGQYYGRILFKVNLKSVSRWSDITSNLYIKLFLKVCINVYRAPIIFKPKILTGITTNIFNIWLTSELFPISVWLFAKCSHTRINAIVQSTIVKKNWKSKFGFSFPSNFWNTHKTSALQIDIYIYKSIKYISTNHHFDNS